MDRQVLDALDNPDAAKENSLSIQQRKQLDGIRGKLTDAELRSLPAEDRENIDLLRAELAKPEDEAFQPEPESIRSAVREQLGLDLTLQLRSMPVLVIEKANQPKQPVD